MNYYYLIAATFLLLIGATLAVASLDENDWIATQTSNHPPSVNITREGMTVHIRWYGGWTDSFISAVRVCDGYHPCQDYAKPRPGSYIDYAMVPENTTFDVYVFDDATQHWFNIATETV